MKVSVRDVNSLLVMTSDELKASLEGIPPAEIHALCDELWENIRGKKLHGGQPRSASSQSSLEYARLGLAIAETLATDELLAEAHNVMAYALNADECFEPSLEYYARAIQAFDRSGQELKGARARLGMMMALSMLGRANEALAAGQLAEAAFQQQGDLAGQARVSVNMGVVYQRLDEHARALQHHMKAAEVFQTLGNDQACAQCYLNIANALSLLDRFEDSDAMYDKSEELSRKLGLNDLWRQAVYNKAYLFFLRGHFRKALTVFDEIRQKFAESGSDRHAALCDLASAEIYLQMNLPSEAGRLARQAVDAFKKVNGRYEHAKAMVFYGVTLTQNRQFADALEVFRSAHGLFEQEKNTYWTAVLELYRAELLLSLGRFWEARALAVSADRKFGELGLVHKTAASLVVRGQLALKLGQLSEARSLAAQIATLSESSNAPIERFPCSLFCARVAEETGDYEPSKRYYLKAAAEIETQRTPFLHNDLRMTFFNGKQEVYRALVTLTLADAGGEDSAFEWCERAKARQLIDMLEHHLPMVRAHSDHTLLARINHLRDELNSRYLQLRSETGELPTLSRADAIDSKETELAGCLREMADIDPEYVSLQSASVAHLRDVQASLPPHATLLEYFVAGDEVLAFVVTPDSVHVSRHLCPLSRVDYLTERLHSGWRSMTNAREGADNADASLKGAVDILSELYAGLIAPLTEHISGSTLFIVPHGMMHYLPFHAFYDGKSYLTDRYDVVFAPSASVLKLSIGSIAARETAPKAGRIRIWTDGDLPRDSIVRRISNADGIHIAAASAYRHDSPIFSGFKVSDGWITALDLFSMTCSADLVTLSGGTSDINRDGTGEDIVAVQRGWLYAGARSVMMRLWNTDDRSTGTLMSAFYDRWQEIKPNNKARSLRLAMREIRAEYPNPYYWAPFVLAGQP